MGTILATATATATAEHHHHQYVAGEDIRAGDLWLVVWMVVGIAVVHSALHRLVFLVSSARSWGLADR